jgi:hypothetical protein
MRRQRFLALFALGFLGILSLLPAATFVVRITR